jgi:tetratricopeptide (TPR) repeat protein
LPKQDMKAMVQEMASRGDHTGVVSLCTQVLERREKLSRDDRVFYLCTQARHWAAINPESWQRQITSALKDALVEAAGDAELEAYILEALSAADVPLRMPTEIEAIVRRFEALAERHPNVRAHGKGIYFNLGYTYEVARDFLRAERAYQLSVDICREFQAHAEVGEALHNLAHVYVRLGKLAEAQTTATEAHQWIPWEHGAAKILCLRGKIAHLAGDLGAARSLFEEAVGHPSADDWTRVDILTAWAELEWAMGHPDKAGDLVKQGLLMAYRLPYPVGVEELNNLAAKMGGD